MLPSLTPKIHGGNSYKLPGPHRAPLDRHSGSKLEKPSRDVLDRRKGKVGKQTQGAEGAAVGGNYTRGNSESEGTVPTGGS